MEIVEVIPPVQEKKIEAPTYDPSTMPSTQKKMLDPPESHRQVDINYAINEGKQIEAKETDTSLNEYEDPDVKIDLEGIEYAKTRIDISWHDVIIKAQIIDESNPENRKRCPPCRKKVKKEITILKGVSGKVKHGQFLSILGASGAGKTTLLNYISGRITDSLECTGKIKINGKEKT